MRRLMRALRQANKKERGKFTMTMKVKCPKCDCEFESEGYSEGRAAFLGMVMGGLGAVVGLMVAVLILG